MYVNFNWIPLKFVKVRELVCGRNLITQLATDHSQILGGGLSNSLWNNPAVGERGEVILLAAGGASNVSVAATFPLKLTEVWSTLRTPLFCTRVTESESPFPVPLPLPVPFRTRVELLAVITGPVWLGGIGGSTRQQGSATGYWVWYWMRARRLGKTCSALKPLIRTPRLGVVTVSIR